MKVAVTGAGGQLGAALLKSCPSSVTPLPLFRQDLDITDRERVITALGQARPAALINAAAWTDVDAAEQEPGRAFEVNASGPRHLAEACREIGALLVQVSSDYVFDGAKDSGPYDERDRTNPINAYGASKCAAERAVREETDRCCIVRTASLYGLGGSRAKGGGFVHTVLERAGRGETLEVVDDIVMSPTSCADLAPELWRLVLEGGSGLYHIANEGWCSWHAFASEIVTRARLGGRVMPVRAQARKRPAKIAAWTALTTVRGIRPRPWKEALSDFIDEALGP